MAVTIVRLGARRGRGEGLRIGTVRRPPRGVPRREWGRRDYYDVWLPNLAPSEALVKFAQAAGSEAQWRTFRRRYAAEMKAPEKAHLLDTLAALSHQTSFAVGCYCEDESHCHRSVLGELLTQRGADVRPYASNPGRRRRGAPRSTDAQHASGGQPVRRRRVVPAGA